jgi:hypothetical protein
MIQIKALQKLREELAEFDDEFDTTDPDWTEVLFRKHVTELLTKRVIRTKKRPRKIGLADLIELVFRSDNSEHGYDPLLEAAQEFDVLLSSYNGEPDEEEMKEARNNLRKVINLLEGIVGNAK